MSLLVVPLSKSPSSYVCFAAVADSLKAAVASSPSATKNSSYFQQKSTQISTSLSHRVDQAIQQWDQLAHAPEKSIKGRIYAGGNALLDRIPVDESFVKAIPSLPAHIMTANPPPSDFLKTLGTIPLLHPTFVPSELVTTHIAGLTTHRIAYHKRLQYLSVGALPFSMAFVVVPGPNLPLFYNLWRLHAHYTALNGARTLEYLTKSTLVKPTPSATLDGILSKDPAFGEDKGSPVALSETTIEELVNEFGGEEKPQLHQYLDRARRQWIQKQSKATATP
ncbi:mitochondrial K+-H+ exchange-related-domain-containing protein [Cladochytrium replicatum]|nr:mitochondrial K+-H+ exchange-related-domain-containing protein [Cladochytrium replicatum]